VIRLLLDQGLPRSTAELLRQDGWDVLHVAECGMSEAPDSQILKNAEANDRIVCTLDADFHALLAVSGATGPSVVRIRREGLRGPELASLLKQVWSRIAEPLKTGALVTITDRAIRVRRLPVIGSSAKPEDANPQN
jgi:predicted nuclease of predicted toxin-antitoxin system